MRKFLLTILALLLPPVAVYVKAGHCWQLYFNLFLCLLLYVPAVFHAFWFVRHHPDPDPEDIDYTNDEVDNQQAAANRRMVW